MIPSGLIVHYHRYRPRGSSKNVVIYIFFCVTPQLHAFIIVFPQKQQFNLTSKNGHNMSKRTWTVNMILNSKHISIFQSLWRINHVWENKTLIRFKLCRPLYCLAFDLRLLITPLISLETLSTGEDSNSSFLIHRAVQW